MYKVKKNETVANKIININNTQKEISQICYFILMEKKNAPFQAWPFKAYGEKIQK